MSAAGAVCSLWRCAIAICLLYLLPLTVQSTCFQALLEPDTPRSANVVTLTFCDFQMLSRVDFDDVAARFPELDARMQEGLQVY